MQLAGIEDPTAGRTYPWPMQQKIQKINALVDKDHSAGSVSGGFKVYRRAEALTVDATRAKFEQITLELMDLMGVAYDTEELLKWSPISFANLIAQGFKKEFPAKILNEKIRGTGVGQMQGILNSACLITADAEDNQDADTLTYNNVLAMRKRAYDYNSAIWLLNPDTMDQLPRLNLISGTAVATTPVWMPSAREDLPDILLGRPLFFTDYCATLGDKGDVILGAWNHYLEAYPAAGADVEAAVSMHVRFLEKENCYRFSMMNDGKCWWTSTFTPPISSVTRSPFVVLAARA